LIRRARLVIAPTGESAVLIRRYLKGGGRVPGLGAGSSLSNALDALMLAGVWAGSKPSRL
jgi:hypothetical protein